MKPLRRKRESLSILVPFLMIALVFGVMIWNKHRTSIPQMTVHQIKKSEKEQTAILFFVAEGSRLGREARGIEPCADTTACLRNVLEELFSGPVGDLDDPMPEGAFVNSVEIQGDMAVVDVSGNYVSEMPSGSSAEMMAVYSIVNTVGVNFPQIAKIKLNVDGDPKAVLSHLDLSDPFAADFTLEQKPAVKADEKAATTKQ